MNTIETLAQEFMRNQTTALNEALRFMKKQKRRNLRVGIAIAIGGYLLHQLDERIFKQECEIRELRNQLEEIKERE